MKTYVYGSNHKSRLAGDRRKNGSGQINMQLKISKRACGTALSQVAER